jgi:hypothetical protein
MARDGRISGTLHPDWAIHRESEAISVLNRSAMTTMLDDSLRLSPPAKRPPLQHPRI